MTDVLNELTHDESDSRRNSTPSNLKNNSKQLSTEPIDICTDCFFLLQQIRKKSRQRHIHRSNYNLSTSSSTSSIFAQQQTQSNLKQTKSIQELSGNNDPLQTLTTIGATGSSQRVTLSRHHLFLKLQPAYDVKLNNIKTG